MPRTPVRGCGCSRPPTPRPLASSRVPGGAPVASSQWLPPVYPIDSTPECRLAAAAAEELAWSSWRDNDDHDLLGVSCSYASESAADGSFHPWPRDAEAGPMGWASWPNALAEALHRVAEEHPDRPLLLTTGAWDDDDERRDATVRGIQSAIAEAVADGVPVRHVQWWSAIDGYEGRVGFGARSGLFDRDREPATIEAVKVG